METDVNMQTPPPRHLPHQPSPMEISMPPQQGPVSALAPQLSHMGTPTRESQPPSISLHASRSTASRQSRRTHEGTLPSSRSQMPRDRDQTPTGIRRSRTGYRRRPALPFISARSYRVGDAKADGNCFFRYYSNKNHIIEYDY